jgi:DNA-binding CsgD family transcriptional regulator
LQDIRSLSPHNSARPRTASTAADRRHHHALPGAVRNQPPGDTVSTTQFSSLSRTELQALHDHWKRQIVHDISSCLDLPLSLPPEGLTLLQAHEQALREAMDHLIVDIFQEVEDCLDRHSRNTTEVCEAEGPVLTHQQIAVLEQLSLGKTPKEIARQLGIRVGTVRTHQRAAYARLGASGRDAAVRAARHRGLLHLQNEG